MKLTKEQIQDYLNGEVADDIIILAAYTIDTTKTETDNQIVAEIADYGDLIVEKIKTISEIDPTAKEALQAAIRLAQIIAGQTDVKWDDFVVNMAAKITGANKKK